MVKAALERGVAFALLLLPLALAGCGEGGGEADPFADTIAGTIEADCLRVTPAAAQTAEKHQRLCTCTSAMIRASGIKARDGDQANDEKIHAAQQACRRQIYGAQA